MPAFIDVSDAEMTMLWPSFFGKVMFCNISIEFIVRSLHLSRRYQATGGSDTIVCNAGTPTPTNQLLQCTPVCNEDWGLGLVLPNRKIPFHFLVEHLTSFTIASLENDGSIVCLHDMNMIGRKLL